MAECMRMIEDNMNGESRIYLPRSGLVQHVAKKQLRHFCANKNLPILPDRYIPTAPDLLYPPV